MCSHTEKLQCLEGEAVICGARLLLDSRRAGGHQWRDGPAGGLSGIRINNLSTLACLKVQALPLSHLLL